MDKGIAIKVENVSKTFKIPHEKVSSLRGAAISAFKKKSYEEFKALDDVSFEVKKGEFFGIIGRNGSGKSTLLKILAGIYQADTGKVSIDGRISPFLELGIGFNPELSGRDNVYLNATVLGLTKKEIDKKFDSIVAFSELERFIDQKLKNYSSGMQVRLAFSVSIHANREILLMDEVLAVGDTNFQSKCLTEFARYKEMGKTVILVSHDIETIRRYCDRAMLIRNGIVKKIGESNKIVTEYIYTNISDEDKRMVAKINDDDGEKRVVNKNAKIMNVNFLNRDLKEQVIFKTGEVINIRVQYEIFKEISNPIFGIIVKNFLKNNVFVTNTEFKKIKTGIVGKGIIDVVFSINNFFADGSYSVSPAIATKEKRIIDWNEDMKIFSIVNDSFQSGGIVDFIHDIIIKK